MFTKSAEFYDMIYSWKDYAAEAEMVRRFINLYKHTPGNTLLDVACGTGHHIEYLQKDYQVEGLDLDAELLKVARERCPGVPFHQGDMVDFDLGKPFDVVTCLFSAIGYTVTVEKLNQSMQSIARHLLPGGVTIVEPWLMPGKFETGLPHARFVDLPDLKIVRMNVSRAEGSVSFLDFHYLVATPEGVEYFTEEHQLGIFSDEQYRAAFTNAGLQVHYDIQGLDGRGTYIGIKP